MKKQFFQRGTLLLAVIALSAGIFLLSSCKKDKDDKKSSVVHLAGTFSGDAEVPPVTTSGTGTITATYDKDTKVLSYTFTWSGLSADATAMHFHKGAVGVSGSVVIPITGFPTAASGTVSGTATLTGDLADLETDLLAGNLYGNIHTANHPGGEVRAQVVAQ